MYYLCSIIIDIFADSLYVVSNQDVKERYWSELLSSSAHFIEILAGEYTVGNGPGRL